MKNNMIPRPRIMSDAFSRNMNNNGIITRSELKKEENEIKQRIRNNQEREEDRQRLEFIYNIIYPKKID